LRVNEEFKAGLFLTPFPKINRKNGQMMTLIPVRCQSILVPIASCNRDFFGIRVQSGIELSIMVFIR
jgi:hypothetical protein